MLIKKDAKKHLFIYIPCPLSLIEYCFSSIHFLLSQPASFSAMHRYITFSEVCCLIVNVLDISRCSISTSVEFCNFSPAIEQRGLVTVHVLHLLSAQTHRVHHIFASGIGFFDNLHLSGMFL